MYAVVDNVSISDFEKAKEFLHSQVIPMFKGMDGFVGGYWLAPTDGKGMSVTVFKTEEAARAAASQVQPGQQMNEYVTLDSVDVREVAGNV